MKYLLAAPFTRRFCVLRFTAESHYAVNAVVTVLLNTDFKSIEGIAVSTVCMIIISNQYLGIMVKNLRAR